jgi:eukaryotic-like serine/threonine-protein kinase
MLTPGGTLGGRYRLDERIATGGMGDVWKAQDTVLGRTVAVKIMQSALLEEPGFVERFRAEARVMATINHPGVVKVYDYGETQVDGGGNIAYLVMEYVDGEALSRTLSRVGRLTPQRTLDLLAQAGDALQAAHDHGIVHRDVKPGNLLVRPDGRLVLTDFGIARSAMSGQLTTAGSILGTASYVSPEQASGSSAITPASDVYSLGVVGYQCLSGRRPFEGDNPVQVAMKHIRDVPPPLPADVPPAVRQLVERAMAKDPGQRWPGAASMADASRRVAAGGPATMSTAAMPGPDGTSVMPQSGPPTGGIPTGPGGYQRGAAVVPAGPPGMVPEEGYTTAGQQPPKRRGLLVAGIILAILIVLVGVVGILYAAMGGNGSPDAKNSPTPSASASQGGNTQTIDLNSYLGQSYQDSVNDLESHDVRVENGGYCSGTNYSPGTVCGYRGDRHPQAGDTVTLYQQPGDDGNNNNGGDGNMPTVGAHSPTGDQNSPPASPSPSPTTASPTSPGSPTGFDSQRSAGVVWRWWRLEAAQ